MNVVTNLVKFFIAPVVVLILSLFSLSLFGSFINESSTMGVLFGISGILVTISFFVFCVIYFIKQISKQLLKKDDNQNEN